MIPSWRAISALYAVVVVARGVNAARRRAFALGVMEGMRATSALGGEAQ